MAALGQENSTETQGLCSPVRGQLQSGPGRVVREEPPNVSSLRVCLPHLVLPTLLPYSCHREYFLRFQSKQQ